MKLCCVESSIDAFDSVIGIGNGNFGRETAKSLTDISSVADLLGSLGTGRSSRSENNRGSLRRRHSNSFESNSAMGMYMLDEEEQWAMALIREIKVALIKTRTEIFDRDPISGSQSNPSSPKNVINRIETSNSLTLADKVSALAFENEAKNKTDRRRSIEDVKTFGNSKNVLLERPERDTLRQVELATICCDSLLRALSEIVSGTQDILEDYLKDEQKHSLLQLVDMHQSKKQHDLLTISQIKNLNTNDDSVSSSTTSSTKNAVTTAIDKLMTWLYAQSALRTCAEYYK